MNEPVFQPVARPTKTTFAPKLIDVDAPSGRKYILRQLNGFQQLQADSASLSVSDSVYYRMGLSIDSIDGEPIIPRPNKKFVDVLLESISGEDADVLVLAYAKAFSPQAQAEEIKNEPTPSD